jgi:hypothetical protein
MGEGIMQTCRLNELSDRSTVGPDVEVACDDDRPGKFLDVACYLRELFNRSTVACRVWNPVSMVVYKVNFGPAGVGDSVLEIAAAIEVYAAETAFFVIRA